MSKYLGEGRRCSRVDVVADVSHRVIQVHPCDHPRIVGSGSMLYLPTLNVIHVPRSVRQPNLNVRRGLRLIYLEPRADAVRCCPWGLVAAVRECPRNRAAARAGLPACPGSRRAEALPMPREHLPLLRAGRRDVVILQALHYAQLDGLPGGHIQDLRWGTAARRVEMSFLVRRKGMRGRNEIGEGESRPGARRSTVPLELNLELTSTEYPGPLRRGDVVVTTFTLGRCKGEIRWTVKESSGDWNNDMASRQVGKDTSAHESDGGIRLYARLEVRGSAPMFQSYGSDVGENVWSRASEQGHRRPHVRWLGTLACAVGSTEVRIHVSIIWPSYFWRHEIEQRRLVPPIQVASRLHEST